MRLLLSGIQFSNSTWIFVPSRWIFLHEPKQHVPEHLISFICSTLSIMLCTTPNILNGMVLDICSSKLENHGAAAVEGMHTATFCVLVAWWIPYSYHYCQARRSTLVQWGNAEEERQVYRKMTRSQPHNTVAQDCSKNNQQQTELSDPTTHNESYQGSRSGLVWWWIFKQLIVMGTGLTVPRISPSTTMVGHVLSEYLVMWWALRKGLSICNHVLPEVPDRWSSWCPTLREASFQSIPFTQELASKQDLKKHSNRDKATFDM